MLEKCVMIIAEAGVNHNGDLSLAKKLIDCAAEAGCDYVKFQTFKSEKLASSSAKKADYQNKGDNSSTQLEMLKKLELSISDHEELIEYCKRKNTKFLSTPFDIESAKYLNSKVDFFKVSSGDLTNLIYLRQLAEFAKPIIISTGMATVEEIVEAIEAISQVWSKHNFSLENNLVVLHCTTSYPTPLEQVNLNAMQTIKKKCHPVIGYSDHTLGIEVPIAAVAMGAKVIEKHFTLDREMEGPDHKASLEPQELCEMVKLIRNIEKSLGSFNKEPTKVEIENMKVARKSLHFSKGLRKGHVITEDDLLMMRPGDGIHARELSNIIGKKLRQDVGFGKMVCQEDFE